MRTFCFDETAEQPRIGTASFGNVPSTRLNCNDFATRMKSSTKSWLLPLEGQRHFQASNCSRWSDKAEWVSFTGHATISSTGSSHLNAFAQMRWPATQLLNGS